jgi:hypothetical protein
MKWALCVVTLAILTITTTADNNVYGEAMVSCGSGHSNGCTYSAGDSGAHEVCVSSLPHGFSSKTGQGAWSDKFTGKPWCICIWAYSNYILHQSSLPLKCKAIPDKVLMESYSLSKFKQCGKMSSTNGCGAEDIRRSITSLCNQCKGQASSASQKSALKAKCDKILQSAPGTAAGKSQSLHGGKADVAPLSVDEVVPEQ